MARCEDFPCCGHTPGDPCPDRDRNGHIVPKCCECGGRLPPKARSSICAGCQKRLFTRDEYGDCLADYQEDY